MARIPVFPALIASCFALSGARAEIGAVGSPHDLKPETDSRAPAESAPSDAATLPPGWWNTQAAAPAQGSAEKSPTHNASAAAQAGGHDAEKQEPMLEVNFSQNHVYFERALATGVKAAESVKPGVVYEVVSYVPAEGGTRSQNERMNARAAEQVQAVVANLRAQGVQESRIRVSTHAYAPDEQLPEHHRVSIFVK